MVTCDVEDETKFETGKRSTALFDEVMMVMITTYFYLSIHSSSRKKKRGMIVGCFLLLTKIKFLCVIHLASSKECCHTHTHI